MFRGVAAPNESPSIVERETGDATWDSRGDRDAARKGLSVTVLSRPWDCHVSLRPALFRLLPSRAYTLSWWPQSAPERRMPVTAKFSKEFYDKLGHGVADELVDWFNKVDAAYQSDLRHLFEARLDRFEARIEQRLAQQKADLVKWMFAFWAPTAVGVIALILR